eukprot:6344802-Pyramimonas_sp.AAC.1
MFAIFWRRDACAWAARPPAPPRSTARVARDPSPRGEGDKVSSVVAAGAMLRLQARATSAVSCRALGGSLLECRYGGGLQLRAWLSEADGPRL